MVDYSKIRKQVGTLKNTKHLSSLARFVTTPPISV